MAALLTLERWAGRRQTLGPPLGAKPIGGDRVPPAPRPAPVLRVEALAPGDENFLLMLHLWKEKAHRIVFHFLLAPE